MKFTKTVIIGDTKSDSKKIGKNKKLKTKVLPYKFPTKKEEEEYINICEIIWGCVPVEVDWAIQTKPYINKKQLL